MLTTTVSGRGGCGGMSMPDDGHLASYSTSLDPQLLHAPPRWILISSSIYFVRSNILAGLVGRRLEDSGIRLEIEQDINRRTCFLISMHLHSVATTTDVYWYTSRVSSSASTH